MYMCCNPTSKARRKRNKEASHKQYALVIFRFQKPNAAFILEKAINHQPLGHNELLGNPGFQTGYQKWAFFYYIDIKSAKIKRTYQIEKGGEKQP